MSAPPRDRPGFWKGAPALFEPAREAIDLDLDPGRPRPPGAPLRPGREDLEAALAPLYAAMTRDPDQT